MASQASTITTFTKLLAMLEANPDETRRHELVDGVLYVTPSPVIRHQRTVGHILRALDDHGRQCGGMAVMGVGVYYDERNYVEPDVLYLRHDHPDLTSERYVIHAPTLAVEVSSDSTRRRDLTVKRRLYERTRVGEYWFVDLRMDVVLVHRHDPGFDQPLTVGRDEVLTSPAARAGHPGGRPARPLDGRREHLDQPVDVGGGVVDVG